MTIVSGGAGRTNQYAAQIAASPTRTKGPSVSATSRHDTSASRDGSLIGPNLLRGGGACSLMRRLQGAEGGSAMRLPGRERQPWPQRAALARSSFLLLPSEIPVRHHLAALDVAGLG